MVTEKEIRELIARLEYAALVSDVNGLSLVSEAYKNCRQMLADVLLEHGL